MCSRDRIHHLWSCQESSCVVMSGVIMCNRGVWSCQGLSCVAASVVIMYGCVRSRHVVVSGVIVCGRVRCYHVAMSGVMLRVRSHVTVSPWRQWRHCSPSNVRVSAELIIDLLALIYVRIQLSRSLMLPLTFR